MKRKSSKSRESGIALLMAIFTLLLLAALGLALLCAADLETTIAANYRDKQVSIYAAMSGLQEARDRLIPSLCDPTTDASCTEAGIDTTSLQVPTHSNGGVIYIINPKNASETVAPWALTVGGKPNPYFDNELCHENIAALGLTNTSGVCPATTNSIPTGSAWYKVYNNLDSSAKGYQAISAAYPKPLSFKWVRITLKTDNMTPALAQGAASNGTVMCWDGSQQVPATSGPGYDTTCATKRSIVLYNGSNTCTTCSFTPPIGTGYVNPVVTISGGGGSGATATAHVVQSAPGKVIKINVLNPGANYTSRPTVTIAAPPIGGTQATATAIVAPMGRPVESFNTVVQTSPIGCYSTTPSVTISAPGGTGTPATATAVMSSTTCIAGWTVGLTNSCSSGTYSNVTAVGGGGSGFKAAIVIKNTGKPGGSSTMSSATITNPGSGYTFSPQPTGITGAGTCTFSVTWTPGKQVQSIQLTNPGSGYTSAPTVKIAAPTMPSGSAPPTVTANLGSQAANAGQVTGFTITNQGSGYTGAPSVTLSGGGGTGATAQAVVGTTGQIDQITLTNAGSGYTSNPLVTITDTGGGTGATIQAQVASQAQLGRVYLLTALAVAPGGSRTMAQMEVATPVSTPFPSTMPAALTLDAPSVHIDPGSSNNYKILGNDANSGGGTAQPPKPSVGVTDNPNSPTSPTAVSCITSVLGGAPNPACPAAGGVKSTNYSGKGTSPDVENVYGSLGALTTVAGADALATAITEKAAYTDVSPVDLTNAGLMSYPNTCPTVVVNGDLTITGGGTYCGVLLVTGTLTLQGDYTWYGPVFVIGASGTFIGGGGGNGQIIGSLFVAQTRDSSQPLDSTGQYPLRSTLGTPTVSFALIGGGGNGIQYDSNWSDRLIQALNLQPVKSSSPLKVLSIRNIY